MPKELTAEEVQIFRARLCEAFARRFAEHGYGSVTMRALADDIGCSPMTPYRYFKDKDEILAAARAVGFRQMSELLEAAREGTEDPTNRVRAVLKAYLDFARRFPTTYRLMYTDLQATPTPYPELEAEVSRARALITEMAASFPGLKEQGVSPSAAAHAFWAALHGVIAIHQHNGFGDQTDFEEVVTFLVTVLIEGGKTIFGVG